MAITHRIGPLSKFDPNKMTPGQWAFPDDGTARFCVAAGNVKTAATREDIEDILDASPEALIALQQAITNLNNNVEQVTSLLNTQTDVNNSKKGKTTLKAKIDEIDSQLAQIAYKSIKKFGVVGDGIYNDYISLQSALDSDEHLYFPKGEYYIETKLILTKSKRILADKGAIIKLKDNIDMDGLVITCDDFVIDGLTINGNATWVERPNDISDPDYATKNELYQYYRDNNRIGIHVLQSTNGLIVNCTVHNTTIGILSDQSENISIYKSKTYDTLADGISVYHGCKNITIFNCDGVNNGDDSFACFGSTEISLNNCEDIWFINNRSINCYARGIMVHGGKNVHIKDNTIKYSHLACVQTYGNIDGAYECDTVDVTGNIIYVKGSYYLGWQPIIIKNCKNINFENNTVREYNHAIETTDVYILIYQAININILNNKIMGGASITDSDNVDFCNNKIYNAYINGLKVINACVNVNVKNNVIIDFNRQQGTGVGITSSGLDAEFNKKVTIKNNVINSIYTHSSDIVLRNTQDSDVDANNGAIYSFTYSLLSNINVSELVKISSLPTNNCFKTGTMIFINADNSVRYWTGTHWKVMSDISGVTSSRPTTGLYVGMRYFDTTLWKPVFLKQISPIIWVDATGTNA